MANEAVRVLGAPVDLVASGASLPNASMSAAPDLIYSIAVHGAGFPHVKFVLTTSFGAAPAVSRSIGLLLRPMNVNGTADSPVPTATYLEMFAGTFVTSADTSQSLVVFAEHFALPDEFEAYLFNSDTGQSMSAGWSLKATPYSYGPAA